MKNPPPFEKLVLTERAHPLSTGAVTRDAFFVPASRSDYDRLDLGTFPVHLVFASPSCCHYAVVDYFGFHKFI